MISHHRILVAPIAALAIVSMQCEPSMSKGVPNGYLNQFAQIITQVIAADKQTYKYMQLVSRMLDKYYESRGHFPRNSAQQDYFRKVAAKYITSNPYQPQVRDLANNQNVPVDTTLPIFFLTDAGLNRESLSSWLKSPPSSWQGEPGSIFIMTNGEGFYFIWAASADRFPMRDLAHEGGMRVISHDLTVQKNLNAVAGNDQYH